MNIPLIYIMLVIIIGLATVRGLFEAVFDGSAKRLALTTALTIIMSISWVTLGLASGQESPHDVFQYAAGFVGVAAAFAIAIASTMAMIWTAIVRRKSLPGKS